MSEHQQFVELCAYYTSGSISDEQLKQLDAHLESCLDCRGALEEFQEIASMGLPSLAPDFAALPKDNDPQASEDRSQRRLLVRIENEIAARRPNAGAIAVEPAVHGNRFGVMNLFRYTRSIGWSAGAVLFGLASIVPLLREYVRAGLSLPHDVPSASHLAVGGLFFIMAGFMNFGFTLVIHAATKE